MYKESKIKIYETTDYSIFDLHHINRDVIPERTNTKKLKKSMLAEGYIPAYPLHVVRDGKDRFRIKGGHHRFYMARELGLPVYFVICNDTATIHSLEAASSPWNVHDHLQSYCRARMSDYLELRQYCSETGISISAMAAMLHGQMASSFGNLSERFKEGRFKIKTRELAENVSKVVRVAKGCGIQFATSQLVVTALSKALLCPEVDQPRLMQKIKAHTQLFQKQTSLSEYMQMLEAIYNRQSSEKIPLAFIAEDRAQKRSAAQPKGSADGPRISKVLRPPLAPAAPQSPNQQRRHAYN